MTAAECGALARAALMAEVSATPKPGLVDRANSGAHRDMDLDTFSASAAALEPFFSDFYALGASLPVSALLPALRARGMEAERAMFEATRGVNTHKGALFSLGLLCAALGAHRKVMPPSAEALCAFVARLTAGISAELRHADTHGGRVYARTGALGVRGEAERGYPSVREIALPALRARLAAGDSENDAAVYALVCLIARAQDTNLLARGGEEGARWACAQAETLERSFSVPAAAALDRAFIARNLSPGGSADLLAAALFLHSVCRDTNSNRSCF